MTRGKLRGLKKLLPALLPGDRIRLLVAVVAGALWAAAFPNLNLAGLAFIAPGLVLGTALGVDGRRAFRLGYVAGFVHYLIALHWLLFIPVNKLAPITGLLALSAFLALFPACWVWLGWKCFPTHLNEGGPDFTTRLRRFAATGWPARARWALTCAALWVAWEMVQARIFTGFPWNLLGASQYRQLPLIQIASVTSVYGVSFAAAWFSVALLCSVAMFAGGSKDFRLWKADIAVPLLVGVCVLAWGVRATLRPPAPAPTLKLALLQPNIPQRWIWDASESSKRFAQVLQLSEQALATKPDLLIWPEAVAPQMARWDEGVHQAITNLVRSHRVWLVLGSDDAGPTQQPGREYEMYNAAFLVSPEGEFTTAYRKQRLVIFGEYLPFHRWLPFLERWTGMGSYARGDGPVQFVAPALRCRMAPLICFEDIFPHWVREHVEEDTDFLVNLTNNGWFGEGAAQWQHAANAVFRAIENGLPLVRCSNNGLTCWVDEQGRMRGEFYEGTKDAYGAGFKVFEVPLQSERRAATYYRRHGDVFGWACVVWSALAVLRGWRAKRIPAADAAESRSQKR